MEGSCDTGGILSTIFMAGAVKKSFPAVVVEREGKRM